MILFNSNLFKLRLKKILGFGRQKKAIELSLLDSVLGSFSVTRKTCNQRCIQIPVKYLRSSVLYKWLTDFSRLLFSLKTFDSWTRLWQYLQGVHICEANNWKTLGLPNLMHYCSKSSWQNHRKLLIYLK